MDASRFDRLTQLLATPTRRRGVLRVAGGALVATHLAGIGGLLTNGTSAKHKRKDHPRHGGARAERRRKKGKVTLCLNGQTIRAPRRKKAKLLRQGATPGPCPGGCVPDPLSVTCASACGEVPNNCGTLVSCGCPAGQQCCAGRCTPAWSNQTTFGTNGTGPSQFSQPFGVARSTDELTLWVADAANHRISVWTRPSQSSTVWTNQTTFGSIGTGPSQFRDPFGVAVSIDGLTAWVADTFNDRISVWTRPDATSTAWTNQTTFGTRGPSPSQFEAPYGVEVSADELTVWVADTENNRISVWSRPDIASTAWTNQTAFGSNGSGPSEFRWPFGVALSNDELTLWVVENSNHRISVWTRPDAASTAWTNQTTFGSFGHGPDELSGPLGVAVSGDELTVWVADEGNDRISVWTRPDGASTGWSNQTTFGSEGSGPDAFRSPTGVTVAADGRTAWVVDCNNHRISVWSAACPE